MLNPLFKGIDRMTSALIILTFSMMCIAIFAQVIRRYIFSFSLPWAEEVGRFLFLALSYLGVSMGMKRQAHLRVDIVLLYMPPFIKKVFEVLSQAICAGFFIFIVYEGISMTMKVWRIEQTAVSLPLPIWVVWACIPFSAFLTTLQCFKNIYELLSGTVPDGVGEQA